MWKEPHKFMARLRVRPQSQCNSAVAKAQRLIAKEESIVEQLQVKRDDAISAAAMDQVS